MQPRSLLHLDVRAGEAWAGRPGVQLGEDAGVIRGPHAVDGCRADPADRADMTTLTPVRRAHEYVVNPRARLHGCEDVRVGSVSVPGPRVGPFRGVAPSIEDGAQLMHSSTPLMALQCG
jgi:hypothetical protein